MNIIKKLLIIVGIIFLNLQVSFAVGNSTIKDNLTSINEENVISGVENGGLSKLDSIINYFQDTLSSLIYLIALAVFIYIGIKLVFARGNPEEFKKLMLHFTYAAVGFFIVAAAWALVKLVAGLDI